MTITTLYVSLFVVLTTVAGIACALLVVSVML